MVNRDPALKAEDILDLIEDIWLPLDPDQATEWHFVLKGKDLEVAEKAIIALRDASNVKPSVRLFDATYRGMAKKPKTPTSEWFEEQRAKLRQREPEPAGESHQELT